MEPTIYTNNILITERISPRFHRILRGDIIIATNPTNPTQNICKRVIGLPGDKIVTDRPYTKINPFGKGSKQSACITNGKDSMVSTIDESKIPLPLSSSSSTANEIEEIDENSNSSTSSTWSEKILKKVVIVPKGHVWIEGDNVENSSDSRYYGPIPQGLIKSRAVLRLWPFTEIKLL